MYILVSYVIHLGTDGTGCTMENFSIGYTPYQVGILRGTHPPTYNKRKIYVPACEVQYMVHTSTSTNIKRGRW